MSVSCVGTCSNCADERFWLSDTLALQLDDGRLKCLPHPAEAGVCEREHGLTLAQASDRGRLYREAFFVCRRCGRDGETIEKCVATDRKRLPVRSAMKWGWGSALVVVPALAWVRWWEAVAVFGGTLAALPAICWWENVKIDRALAARGLPRPDAPGRVAVPAPTAGSLSDDTVVGRIAPSPGAEARATLRASGPCCDEPDWVEAYRVKDEDRVPCPKCGGGVMIVSNHAIH